MNRPATDRLVEELGIAGASARCGVAAVLFTYRCSIHCRHCLFGAAPDRPNVVMTAQQCADALRLLHETGRVVHIAGGEPMWFWDGLAESVRIAHAEGNAPHFIETNCSFAADDHTVYKRFRFLRDYGVRGILASADPYHQEFVPAERFLRVRRIAGELFGPRNFWGSDRPEEEIRDFATISRDPARLRDYTRRHPPVAVGSAYRHLAPWLDRFAPDDEALPARGWRGAADAGSCRNQFAAATMWELHIDPYGNIQTNCGILLGRVPQTTPARLLARGPEHANRFVKAVCEGGARGLAHLAAREHGFRLPVRVSQTCELCYLARSFLRSFHPDVFGPEEVYM